MSINIQGILNNYKGRKITIFSDDNGNAVSDSEARKYLAECLAKGWQKIPMCKDNECPNFDHFGGGCPGHHEFT